MNKFVLRYYQEEAVSKALWACNKFEDNSLIVLPTAAGKSLVSAGIADRLNKEILILQPSKEILEQNMKKLGQYVPQDEIGVYSASFKRKDINKFTFATIQSVYKVPELFKHIGQVIVDECDLVNNKNASGMFTSFLREIGKPSMLGLTATPYRLTPSYSRTDDGGLISTTSLKLINRTNPRMWNRIIYNINNRELTAKGYLSPIIYSSRTVIDQKKIPTNKGMTDFNLEAFTKLLSRHEQQILESISAAKEHRKAILVFCSSLDQAERMSNSIKDSAFISGKTPMKERDRLIKDFREGRTQVMFNVGVLTVGFDYPELDCIYLLRPTRSLRLYYQMLGRGVRIAEGKKNCVVIDYSGTYDNLGAVEDIILDKNEKKLWELYANNEPRHAVPLFSWEISSAPKGNIRF
jgi:DNA repair protein RadD